MHSFWINTRLPNNQKSNNYMQKSKILAPVPKQTLQQKLLDAFTKYQDTTSAIIEDYLAGNDGMLTELAAADVNFREQLETLAESSYFSGLSAQDLLEETFNRVDDNDISVDDLLTRMEEGDLIDQLEAEGYVCVKIDNLRDRMKLEDFVNSNIYPYNLSLTAQIAI
jgi:hypothetical protein